MVAPVQPQAISAVTNWCCNRLVIMHNMHNTIDLHIMHTMQTVQNIVGIVYIVYTICTIQPTCILCTILLVSTAQYAYELHMTCIVCTILLVSYAQYTQCELHSVHNTHNISGTMCTIWPVQEACLVILPQVPQSRTYCLYTFLSWKFNYWRSQNYISALDSLTLFTDYII